MSTEVWFRNPLAWTPKLVEVGANRIVWHYGTTVKRRIDPVAHARLHYPEGTDWRVMVMAREGARCYGPASADVHDPLAVFPVWQFGQPFADLESLVVENLANDEFACEDPSLPPDLRPRPGQEHRVVIVDWPSMGRGQQSFMGRRFLTMVGEMQQDYPDCKIHMFEVGSFRTGFGFGFGSIDFDPVIDAAHKRVHLPNGRPVKLERLPKCRQWVNLLGMSITDLQDFGKRVEFNIRSALWAGENYGRNIKFRTSGTFINVDPTELVPPKGSAPETKLHTSRPISTVPGDKVLCDTCSISFECKFSRAGAVCSLPGSETVTLSKFFKSRDADMIMDGLAEVLAIQSARAEKAVEWEDESGELDKEVTKVLNSIFDGAVQLAKLRNPALAAGPKIALQINNGAGSTALVAANPKSMMAAVVKELEERGVPRSEITPEVVMKMIEGHKPEIVEAEVLDDAV